MTEDVAFYVELAREADGPVVELAVGNGASRSRSRERSAGRRSGSTRRLRCSRARASGPRPPAWSSTCGRATCASSRLDEPAASSYCPFRSLLHLPPGADRRRVFERVARRCARAAASPGTPSSSPPIATEIDGQWRDERRPPPVRLRPGRQPRRHHARERRLVSLWWVARSEWEALLDVAGLEIEALYGWFDRRPFDEIEPRVRLRRAEAGAVSALRPDRGRSTTRGRRRSPRTSASTSRRRSQRAGRSSSSRSGRAGSRSRSRRPGVAVIGVD